MNEWGEEEEECLSVMTDSVLFFRTKGIARDRLPSEISSSACGCWSCHSLKLEHLVWSVSWGFLAYKRSFSLRRLPLFVKFQLGFFLIVSYWVRDALLAAGSYLRNHGGLAFFSCVRFISVQYRPQVLLDTAGDSTWWSLGGQDLNKLWQTDALMFLAVSVKRN